VLAGGEGGEVDGIVRRSLFRTMETRLEIRIKSPTYFDAPETDPSKLGPAPSEDDPKYGEYMNKSSNEKRDTYTLIDKKFGDEKNTTLEVEIRKGSSEVPKLDVGKKVKIKISG
jgi:hypothetical protein